MSKLPVMLTSFLEVHLLDNYGMHAFLSWRECEASSPDNHINIANLCESCIVVILVLTWP